MKLCPQYSHVNVELAAGFSGDMGIRTEAAPPLRPPPLLQGVGPLLVRAAATGAASWAPVGPPGTKCWDSSNTPPASAGFGADMAPVQPPEAAPGPAAAFGPLDGTRTAAEAPPLCAAGTF